VSLPLQESKIDSIWIALSPRTPRGVGTLPAMWATRRN
jgi:hypothetical protein